MSIFVTPVSLVFRSFVSDNEIYHLSIERCRINGEEYPSVFLSNDNGRKLLGRAAPLHLDEVATLPIKEVCDAIFGVVPHDISEAPPKSQPISQWGIWSPRYRHFCSLISLNAQSGYIAAIFFSPQALVGEHDPLATTITIEHRIQETIRHLLADPTPLFEDVAPLPGAPPSECSCTRYLNLVVPLTEQVPGRQRPLVVLKPNGATVDLSFRHIGKKGRALPSSVHWGELHQTLRAAVAMLDDQPCLLPFVLGDTLYRPREHASRPVPYITLCRYTFTAQRRALVRSPHTITVPFTCPPQEARRYWIDDPVAAFIEATL